MSNNDWDGTDRRGGRPRKGEPPRIPYEELDRILVFGDVVPCDDGKNTTVVYPSYRELARRYGVSNSLVASYAKKHNCMRRRQEAQARVAAKSDQKLIEIRANAIALSKDDELRIIDSYLAGFERAVAENRVRFDNPSDFNTMVRLKEFIQGGADSRQEIHASLSLEDIQSRHRRMMKSIDSLPAATRGDLGGKEQAALSGTVSADSKEATPPMESAKSSLEPPGPFSVVTFQKMSGQFLETDQPIEFPGVEIGADEPDEATTRETDAPLHDAPTGREFETGAHMAPTAREAVDDWPRGGES